MSGNRFSSRMLALGLLATAGVVATLRADHPVVTAAPPANASVFVPITPARLVDTRNGTGGIGGRFSAEEVRVIPVTGRLGVPAAASAVMLNVTAVDAGGRGYVQVVPNGRGVLRASSTLNVDEPGQTIPNAAFAPLGDGGAVQLFTTFATDIVIDVSGYFVPAQSASAGRLQPLTPTRILDTRISLGWTPPATTAPPNTAPPTTAPPTSSKPANPGDSKNCTDFASYAEAKAWFDTYFPYYGDIADLDSDHDGIPCETLKGAPKLREGAARVDVVGAGTIIHLQVTGRGGVPTDGASAVVMNVTAVEPQLPGYVQVAPTPVNIGASSNLNVAPGRTIANLVVVPLGSGGQVDLYTTSHMELVADVVGYFSSSSAPTSAAGLFVPVTPDRQLDTRTTAPTPVIAGSVIHTDVSDVAPSAIAIAGNLTATESMKFGFLQIAAPPIAAGTSSNLNIAYDAQTIANAIVSPVAGGIVDTFNNSPMHEILDVTGWFTPG